LHRPGDLISPEPAAQHLADNILTARLVQVPGDDHLVTVGALEPVLDEIEGFLARRDPSTTTGQILATALVTILVVDLLPDVTEAVPSGDQPAAPGWSGAYLTAAQREIEHHGGRVLSSADGRLHATFMAPSRALACAIALRTAVLPVGQQVRMGIHTGECRLADRQVSGTPVLISGHVAALARTGEILVTGTVKDLLAGSATTFSGRGSHQLLPISPSAQLYAVS
jgi:class 3 adenylate cyclase